MAVHSFEHLKGNESPAFTDLNNLAAAEVGGDVVFATDDWFALSVNMLKVGGDVVFATDDWFALSVNMLKCDPPEWRDGVFTTFGKWMDGWETQRRRIAHHDWCIIKLGIPGVIKGLDIDTSYFTGNYPPRVSVQAACLPEDVEFPEYTKELGSCATSEEMEEINKIRSEEWIEILPRSNLRPGYIDTCHNYFPVNVESRFTHLRLNLFPDGGIARFKVYGYALKDWSKVPHDKVIWLLSCCDFLGWMIDLVAMVNGGRAIAWSNKHYGHPRNLIAPGRAPNMGNGWETARRLDRPAILEYKDDGCLDFQGYEWAVLGLGHPGIIKKIEVDTNHFKGNFPDSCIIEGCAINDKTEIKFANKPEHVNLPWKILLPSSKLAPHKCHYYTSAIQDCGTITHVKITIFPDGGISRLRLLGYPRTNTSSRL